MIDEQTQAMLNGIADQFPRKSRYYLFYYLGNQILNRASDCEDLSQLEEGEEDFYRDVRGFLEELDSAIAGMLGERTSVAEDLSLGDLPDRLSRVESGLELHKKLNHDDHTVLNRRSCDNTSRIKQLEHSQNQLFYFSRVSYRALKKLLKTAGELDDTNGYSQVLDLLERANPNKWNWPRAEEDAPEPNPPRSKVELPKKSPPPRAGTVDWEHGEIRRSRPRANTKALRVWTVVKEHQPITINGIAEETGMPLKAARQILWTLFRQGYLARGKGQHRGVYKIAMDSAV